MESFKTPRYPHCLGFRSAAVVRPPARGRTELLYSEVTPIPRSNPMHAARTSDATPNARRGIVAVVVASVVLVGCASPVS